MGENAIVLTRCYPNGYVSPSGPRWHFVCRSDFPLTVTDQIKQGALWPGQECGDADIESWLLAILGIRVSIREIEKWSGTTGLGTTIQGLVVALAHFGISSRIVHGLPSANAWWMNSGTAVNDPPSESGRYIAGAIAAGSWMIIIDTPVHGGPTPGPTPPPHTSGEPMATVRKPNGLKSVYTNEGNHILEWWEVGGGAWDGPFDVTAAGHPALPIAGEPSGAAGDANDDVSLTFRAQADNLLYVQWKINGQWNGPIQLPHQKH